MENVYMYLKSLGMNRFGTFLVAHTYIKFKDVYRFVKFSVAHTS